MIYEESSEEQSYPAGAGVLLGIGLGGFVEGIVFQRVLQWHQMLTSAGYPATTVFNLRLNLYADGLFDLAMFACIVAGIIWLWSAAQANHQSWYGIHFLASVLIGWGLFNLVEGIVSHQLLGIHHLRDSDPNWVLWDLAYLAWGVLMIAGGRWLMRLRPRATEQRPAAKSNRAAIGVRF